MPVIDSLAVPFEAVAKVAVGGPMVAVGEKPDVPPWNSLAFVPLRVVADAHHDVGAEVFNIRPG